ncbi:MAG: MerR family DNA-binding transcriptional regulator, partial [Candidatus Limnocylindria bacterium]
MRIGELASLTGLATSAVRYYEQLGLVPKPERTASGYR